MNAFKKARKFQAMGTLSCLQKCHESYLLGWDGKSIRPDKSKSLKNNCEYDFGISIISRPCYYHFISYFGSNLVILIS